MDKELLEALKAALKAKGLNEGLAGKFISVENKEGIDAAINDFIELNPSTPDLTHPEIVKAIDQARTQAVKTNTANLAKKFNFDPNANPEPPKNDPPVDETPTEKALREKLEEMEAKFKQFTVGQTQAQKQAKAKSLIESSKIIPEKLREKWVNRFDINSETSLEEQLKGLEEEFNEIDQEYKNNGQFSGKPQQGFSNDKPSQSDIDAVVTI